MSEHGPTPWDLASPIYQRVPRDDHTEIDAAAAIAALMAQRVAHMSIYDIEGECPEPRRPADGPETWISRAEDPAD